MGEGERREGDELMLPTPRDLEGKVAIVTGAAVPGGIGRETARLLASAGASVIVADLPSQPLAEAAADVGRAGTAAHHPVDLSDQASVQELIAFAVSEFGGLDVVNNNAAHTDLGVADGLIADMELETWDKAFDVNARGTMLMCKHAIPQMIERGGGSIVNIASATFRGGDDFATAYACSKAAVVTLTRYVATQYGEYGIRCNAVSPGLILTSKAESFFVGPVLEALTAQKLVGRLGAPRDIAQAVLFLASARSAFITGELFPVDGGLWAHLPMVNDERALRASQADGGQ